MGLYPPSMLQTLKNIKLVGLTETQSSLKDISTKGAHHSPCYLQLLRRPEWAIPGTFTMAGNACNRKLTI